MLDNLKGCLIGVLDRHSVFGEKNDGFSFSVKLMPKVMCLSNVGLEDGKCRYHGQRQLEYLSNVVVCDNDNWNFFKYRCHGHRHLLLCGLNTLLWTLV